MNEELTTKLDELIEALADQREALDELTDSLAQLSETLESFDIERE